ncbi:MAG: hypothetical protein AAGD14_04505 [Planctomycetota bacterium]
MSLLRTLLALLLSILLAFCGGDVKAGDPVATPPDAPRFAFPGLEESLSLVSWDELGAELVALQPLLAQAAEEGRAPARVEPLRSQVRARLDRLQKAGLAGSGPQGVLLHPAVLVNAIDATLGGADCPLTAAQAADLRRIGGQFLDQDRARRRGQGAEPLALARLLEEIELKQRLMLWTRHALTPRQQAILEPASVRGRVGCSLFAGHSILGPYARPIAYVTRDELVPKLLTDLTDRFLLNEAEASIVRTHLERFARRTAGRGTARDLNAEAALAVAQATVELRRELGKELSLRPAVRAALRSDIGFAFPIEVAGPLVRAEPMRPAGR